jgi:hypothetical protein
MQFHEAVRLFKIKFTSIKFQFLVNQCQNIVQMNVLI